MYSANKMRLKNAEKEVNDWLEKELEKGNSVTLNEVLNKIWNKIWKTLDWDYHPEYYPERNIKHTDYIFYADNSIYAEENEFPDEAKKEDETVGKTLGDVAKDIKKALGVEESDMSNEEDVVNHPSHYAGSCSIECFDVMRMLWTSEELANYCLINAFKYIWRHKNKNGLEDLRKAEWYMNKATEIMPVSYRWDIAIDLRRQLAHAFDEYDIEKEI